MSGQPETITPSADGKSVGIARGERGEVIINFSNEPQTVDIKTPLPDGEYKDKVYGTVFVVKNGTLTGQLNPLTSYIIEI